MNRKKIFLIIALMGLSITGITLMQIHWMLKTIALNEENFDRAVNEALTVVVDKLEKANNIRFSMPFQGSFWDTNEDKKSERESVGGNSPSNKKRVYAISGSSAKAKIDNYYKIRYNSSKRWKKFESSDSTESEDSFDRNSFDKNKTLASHQRLIDSIEKNEIYKVLKTPLSVTVTMESIDTSSNSIKIIRNDSISRIVIISDDHVDTINSQDLPLDLYPPPPPPAPSWVDKSNSSHYFVHKEKSNGNKPVVSYVDSNSRHRYSEKVITLSTKEVNAQTKKQQQALKQLVYEMDARRIDLKDRVNFEELKNLLAAELKNKGLMVDFEFVLTTKNPERKEVFSTPQFNTTSAKSIYSTRLFPNNFVPLNDFLEIKFPHKDSAVYKSVILPISASLFFTLIVFLTFTITLVTIIKQKKLAEMKADFINNMTHELKTPIATISLASDSIDNPKVVDKPETVKYFTAIIREENSRMNKLVESVLQTARLERKTLKLNLKEINLSLLTNKVADQMGIQAKAKEGSIQFNKPDEDILLIADEGLMENVIFNLIDNAIKYSSAAPEVIITLKKLPGGISLSVQDNGIGMSRSEQQRVFEKFYRISQGDVHNIKGFGLGLSNVKEITELHGGIVHLRSELGRGSTFSLFFPLKVNGND